VKPIHSSGKKNSAARQVRVSIDMKDIYNNFNSVVLMEDLPSSVNRGIDLSSFRCGQNFSL
jgi:hypothetical protein